MNGYAPEERAELVLRAVAGSKASPSGWARGQCPFCPSTVGKVDRRGSFSVREDVGAYFCFRCGSSGRVDLPGGPREFVGAAKPVPVAMKPPPGWASLSSSVGLGSEALRPARDYLDERGISRDRWAEAEIGACATGRFGGRVVVPVLTQDGAAWLGFVGRTWVKRAEVPYLYPSGMARGQVLYNHSALHEETDEPVMVVEGVFDTLALWPHSVAVLGKPSDDQVEALVLAKRPVAVVLDGDAHEEGQALAWRLQFAGARAGSVRLPPKMDPDDVDLGCLRDAARRSIGAVEAVAL